MIEQGPIRPPNEAMSLLVRVTRNCPWNRCAFCPVYAGERFSLRDVDDVKRDIDGLAGLADAVSEAIGDPATRGDRLRELSEIAAIDCDPALHQVLRFVRGGSRSAFLQDANSLIMPAERLVEVLEHLRAAFPGLERVTTYARSHTITKRSVEELRALREAGLDRVHVGLESGSDAVLAMVEKGVTAERHIEAGRLVKEAGIELSEYVMPGLGGRALSDEHARETARTLREIGPRHIRLRTLALSPRSTLHARWQAGAFEPLGDIEVVQEIRTLLEGLYGVTATLRSDHVLNLLQEVDGELPRDLPAMLATIDGFLALPAEEQDVFVAGRRCGVLQRLDDLRDQTRVAKARHVLAALRAQAPGSLDDAVRRAMSRFV